MIFVVLVDIFFSYFGFGKPNFVIGM